mmetsp:Transcript_12310/g.26832  ORF Transcript_12310/g.26832 Transcript_12310/m.26832 type:complete len:102 (-) Transcript_12310:2588-2893(-)
MVISLSCCCCGSEQVTTMQKCNVFCNGLPLSSPPRQVRLQMKYIRKVADNRHHETISLCHETSSSSIISSSPKSSSSSKTIVDSLTFRNFTATYILETSHS